MIFKVLSVSPEETVALGEKIGMQLKGQEIILISGALGVGKTLLTKGIAKGLGIQPDDVVSPTFVLMNTYSGRHRLFHFDLYRLGMNGRVEDPEIEDYIDDGIIILEWAQFLKSEDYSSLRRVEVFLQHAAADAREISIQTDLEYINV